MQNLNLKGNFCKKKTFFYSFLALKNIFLTKTELYFYISTTLKIDIAKNSTESTELSLSWSSSVAPELFEELHLVGDLSAKILVSTQAQEKLLLTGSLVGVQRLTCARTLEPFDHSFETELVIEVERKQIASQVLDDEDPEVFCLQIPVAQDYVDISECIRQLVILQEPMYPVKNPDEDFSWNDKETDSAEDPRWAQLKALRRKMDKSK